MPVDTTGPGGGGKGVRGENVRHDTPRLYARAAINHGGSRGKRRKCVFTRHPVTSGRFGGKFRSFRATRDALRTLAASGAVFVRHGIRRYFTDIFGRFMGYLFLRRSYIQYWPLKPNETAVRVINRTKNPPKNSRKNSCGQGNALYSRD